MFIMDNEQEAAVTEPAEPTVETESAPVEQQADDTSSTPADAIVEPKKVSESVPYDRFAEVNTKAKTLEEENLWLKSQLAPKEQVQDQPFDEETTRGVLTLAQQEARKIVEAEKTADWVKAHADDLKNPLVDSRTKDLIKSGIDRDEAIARAKQEVDALKGETSKEAKSEGFNEGQKIAQNQQKYGAVGESKVNEKVDPSKLSSEEYAKHFNIPRQPSL